jgi:hypothetical protein
LGGGGGAIATPGDTTNVVYASGAPEFITPPATVTPLKLVSGLFDLGDFWSQGDRIHWGGRAFDVYQSCSVHDCASTVESVDDPYVRRPVNALGIPQEGWPDRYRVTFGTSGRRGAGDSLTAKTLTFDENFAYALSGDVVLRCHPESCDDSLAAIPLRSPIGAPLTFRREIPGRLLVDDKYIYANNDHDVVRLSKSGPFVDSRGEYVEYEPLLHRDDELGGFSLHGDRMYWLNIDSNLLGTLRSCPKSGCVGEPEIHATAAGTIGAFLIDGDNLYLIATDGADQSAPRLLRCPLADCSDPTLLFESPDLRLSELLVVENWLLFTAYGDGYGTGYIGLLPK